MNVSKHLLPFIALACCASAARAQRITSADSVLLFRTDANATSTNGSVVKTKGKVTQIALRPDGSADVYVFKQHAGILKTTAKVKGLPSGLAVIPGLTQLRFAPGQGIVPVRDELFNLNSGLKQPIGYQLLDIDASRPKGAEPEVITDDRQGADYNKALRENPVAMGYRGDTRNYYVYSSGDRSALTLTTQQEAYDPYSASSRLQTPQSRKIMTLSAKAVPFTAAPLAYANALAGMAVAFRPDDGAFLALDSTGRTTHTEIVPELKGLRPLAASPVYETVSGGMLDIAEAMRQVGTDYVLGLTSSDKGYKESGYWVARVANDGRVLFKHPFEAKMEDYIPNGSVQVASNSDECIVQVELRKSMLKYTTIRIKANSGGIVYNRTTTADELKAMPIARGKEDGAVPGNTPAKTWYLLSLPSGENLIVGQNASQGLGISYNVLHLNADGSVKRLFVTGSLDKTADPRVDHQPFAALLADGRLLLVAEESTGLSKALLTPYSLLEANLADGYPAETQGTWKAGEKNLLFNTTVAGDQVERKGAIGFLEKMANATDVGRLSAQEAKAQYAVETLDAPLTAPSVILIDPEAGTISRTSLRRTGGYALPHQPLLYVDAATGKFTYFSRTLPERKARDLTDAQGRKHYGNGVYLKVIQGEL